MVPPRDTRSEWAPTRSPAQPSATGYQSDRAKDALAKILEAFIDKELQPWAQTFPADFYREMFRLRGLAFPTDTVKGPQYFGVLTNNVMMGGMWGWRRFASATLAAIKGLAEREGFEPSKGFWPLHP